MNKQSQYGDDDVLGPFNKDEFKEKQKELGILDPGFTKEYYGY
jgi:hypothetical protein